ncbi:MAG TPA: hypothetical protein VM223_00395, partial [Planctomycetota bacterium]|nr:hypothetical protein [Planctomycetota bacterium]
MFEPHPVFKAPSDPETSIWRYINVDKFRDLLDTRCLFFAWSDKLGDPYEGSSSRVNVQRREEELAKLPLDVRSRMEFHDKDWRKFMAINCWHMNDHESEAMWRIYLSGGEGIALQSTYNRLVRCFGGAEDVFVGVVKYIDHNDDPIPDDNIFWRFLHKRKSLIHERE